MQSIMKAKHESGGQYLELYSRDLTANGSHDLPSPAGDMSEQGAPVV